MSQHRLYPMYKAMASRCSYLAPVRKTPWLLVKLMGKPPYRRWEVRGPVSMRDDLESLPGKWRYQEQRS